MTGVAWLFLGAVMGQIVGCCLAAMVARYFLLLGREWGADNARLEAESAGGVGRLDVPEPVAEPTPEPRTIPATPAVSGPKHARRDDVVWTPPGEPVWPAEQPDLSDADYRWIAEDVKHKHREDAASWMEEAR